MHNLVVAAMARCAMAAAGFEVLVSRRPAMAGRGWDTRHMTSYSLGLFGHRTWDFISRMMPADIRIFVEFGCGE